MVTFGDLTGDGIQDAAVIISFNGGGSGTSFRLVGVANRNGVPVQVASTALGDRVEILQVVITGNGEIQVNMITQGPNDPLCCPTMQVYRDFRLTANGFQESVQ